jgi:hypothetical protein
MATREKDKGNESYKAKDFKEAHTVAVCVVPSGP